MNKENCALELVDEIILKYSCFVCHIIEGYICYCYSFVTVVLLASDVGADM